MIVAEQSYEVTDPTVDQQIISLKGAGANVLFDVSTPKFVVQAIRKAHDIGWKPMHFIFSPSASIGSVLTPAGPDKSAGSSLSNTSRTRPTRNGPTRRR